MTKQSFTLIRPDQTVMPMPLEKRAGLFPRIGFCSTRPARHHRDALVLANGSLRMLLDGDPRRERLIFSHESLFETRQAPVAHPPRIAPILPAVRKMLLDGRFQEVPAYVIDEVTCDRDYDRMMRTAPDGKTRWSIPNRQPHIACLAYLDLPDSGFVQDYLRCVDLARGEAVIRWTDQKGSWQRRSFVSKPDQVACTALVVPPGQTADLQLRVCLETIPGSHGWDYLQVPRDVRTELSFAESGLLVFTAHYPGQGGRGYQVATRVVSDGGTVAFKDGRLCLNGAHQILLLTRILPSVRPGGPDDVLPGQLLDLPTDYAALLERHAAGHEPMMRRCSLELADETSVLLSVEELLERQRTAATLEPALLEKLFHMGRFFLINDTGELPPAQGQYNINVNLQVCSGNLTNLPEPMQVFFRFFESKFADFRDNARAIFGCRGILASIHPDAAGGHLFHFSGPWPHLYWISCAGWVFNEFWGHYLVSGDEIFLREHIVPGLREIALFYEDYLSESDEAGHLLFYPCFSPENGQQRGYPITINAVMDIMVCREVLTNLIQACHILGLKEPGLDRWQDILDHLPPLLLDEEGALREWAWDSIEDDLDHRHVSHHYAAWPGFAANWADAPELSRAILISNRKRGQENDSAHGLMHRLFTAIRLRDADGVWFYHKQLLEHGFVNASLTTNHFPYKAVFADVLGGMPAALAEMLVQSRPGVVDLLPVLPGFFRTGRLAGVCLYTFAVLTELSWDFNRGLVTVSLQSLRDQAIRLSMCRQVLSVAVDGRTAGSDQAIHLKLSAGQTVEAVYWLRPDGKPA